MPPQDVTSRPQQAATAAAPISLPHILLSQMAGPPRWLGSGAIRRWFRPIVVGEVRRPQEAVELQNLPQFSTESGGSNAVEKKTHQ